MFLYNSGEMIATGGYSAISTSGGNGNSNAGWIYNLEGGRIYGENPLAALVDLGRPYNFHNAGEVTVKGDGAVAIRTGTGGYTTRVVNDGVINVGTQEGREDGTNGEGLVGIQAPGAANIVNNTANGVINVWADNSWAFEKTSSDSILINNGSVVLHGTGGGIIKDSEDDGRGMTMTFPFPIRPPSRNGTATPAWSTTMLSAPMLTARRGNWGQQPAYRQHGDHQRRVYGGHGGEGSHLQQCLHRQQHQRGREHRFTDRGVERAGV
ncbi:hypothetical protein ABC733_12895 [Mangrovibacter sp. SLW1]